MSTRCNITIKKEGAPTRWLYHHHDGYPDFMCKKLSKFLEYIRDMHNLSGMEWTPRTVAEMMVYLSIEDYNKPITPFSTPRANSFDADNPDAEYRPNQGHPAFEHTNGIHGDIDFSYIVKLKKDGECTVHTINVREEQRREDAFAALWEERDLSQYPADELATFRTVL